MQPCLRKYLDCSGGAQLRGACVRVTVKAKCKIENILIAEHGSGAPLHHSGLFLCWVRTRTQEQCDVLVSTVYLPQVSLSTHLLTNSNEKEQLGKQVAHCLCWGSDFGLQIISHLP